MASQPSHKTYHHIAKKLHRQFAHPTYERLMKLVKNSGYNNKQLDKEILKVSEQCLTCLKYKKTPPRPVVSLPMAKKI